MTSAAGKNETSHHPSDLLSSKIGCSNEISVLHWKQVLCWSHLGCIRTKFLKSWFHVIDDYRLKFFFFRWSTLKSNLKFSNPSWMFPTYLNCKNKGLSVSNVFMNNIQKHSFIVHHVSFSLRESSMILFNSSTARDKKMTKNLKLKFAKYYPKKKTAQVSYSNQASWL